MITDIRDITSFKWATVTNLVPIAIKLDGDTAPLALIPDSLVDPLLLKLNDRVRVELSLRKVIIHGKSSGVAPVQPWKDFAYKFGPTSWSSAYKAVWATGRDSGGSLDATSATTSIKILETGYYDIQAVQRGASSADYITLALNGVRTDLENRLTGIFTHDHAAGANNYSTSRYVGLLNANELITAGSPSAGGGLVYVASSITGSIIARRIS